MLLVLGQSDPSFFGRIFGVCSLFCFSGLGLGSALSYCVSRHFAFGRLFSWWRGGGSRGCLLLLLASRRCLFDDDARLPLFSLGWGCSGCFLLAVPVWVRGLDLPIELFLDGDDFAVLPP